MTRRGYGSAAVLKILANAASAWNKHSMSIRTTRLPWMGCRSSTASLCRWLPRSQPYWRGD